MQIGCVRGIERQERGGSLSQAFTLYGSENRHKTRIGFGEKKKKGIEIQYFQLEHFCYRGGWVICFLMKASKEV
jgi:gamma-glutamylcysteine synthetase